MSPNLGLILLSAALVLSGVCLYLVLPRGSQRQQRLGFAAGVIGFALMVAALPASGPVLERIVFWSLAAVTVFAAILAISMRSAVYTAIWFAISLIGVAGLFLFQGAQFLGVVTVVVYAGAIVVMFLFVIMLAQPDGHSVYDRIAWGTLPKFLAVATATLSIGLLGYMVMMDKKADRAPQVSADEQSAQNPLLDSAHTAHLGRELFSRHLVSVELAGTLLLIALVGAVAIVIHGNSQRPAAGGSSL